MKGQSLVKDESEEHMNPKAGKRNAFDIIGLNLPSHVTIRRFFGFFSDFYCTNFWEDLSITLDLLPGLVRRKWVEKKRRQRGRETR